MMDETHRCEQARFEYVPSCIERTDAVAVDPISLPLPEPGRRVEHTARPGTPLFGGIRDASADPCDLAFGHGLQLSSVDPGRLSFGPERD